MEVEHVDSHDATSTIESRAKSFSGRGFSDVDTLDLSRNNRTVTSPVHFELCLCEYRLQPSREVLSVLRHPITAVTPWSQRSQRSQRW